MRKLIRTHTKFMPAMGLVIIVFIIGVVGLISFHTHQTDAAPVVGFKPGLIIDDSVFTNKKTMDVSQIQQFLNSKMTNCDTDGTQPASDFGRPDLTHAQYAASVGWPAPPYICLRDYSENGTSSSQIIYNAAQQYNINPQVLIVLLQKEQSLVTDNWPLPSQYRKATGYGCPDTALCDSQYNGFTNQVNWAATLFRAIMNASPTWYSPFIVGNNKIYYNPGPCIQVDSNGTCVKRDPDACGSSIVNIQNRATQALYSYTPYQPNQATLDAGWGTAPCGAYGNRNFYLYFTGWFGNTTGPDYAGTVDSVELFSDAPLTVPANKVGSKYILQPSQIYYARITATNTGRVVWDGMTNLGTSMPIDRTSALYSPTWINPYRVVTVGNESTAPYDSSTVSFQLNAPSSPSLLSESFNLVQDGVAWMSAGFTISAQVATTIDPPTDYTGNILPNNSTLKAGESLMSPDGYTTLSLSEDGVLQLRRDYQTVWSVGTSAGLGSILAMQSDGNLVLYRKTGVPVWNSVTNGLGESTLHIQEDGNMVIYNSTGGTTWSSDTSLGLSHYAYPSTSVSTNGILVSGQAVRSVDRKYNLYLQTDGNLVLYSPTKAIWASNTVGSGATQLIMQADGNLVLYNKQGQPVWNSGTPGHGPSNLNVQPDGNLVIYANSGATWASNTNGRQ